MNEAINREADMRHMLEDLLQAVQALQQEKSLEAHMENPKGNGDPLDKDDRYDDEHPSHDAGPANNKVGGGLDERLGCAFCKIHQMAFVILR